VGYYSFGDKELVLYHDPADVEETLTTLFHEGTHLFCHLALGDRIHALPIWVLEGTAEYFGTARFDREAKDLEYGRVNHGRLIEARALLARPTTSLKGDLLAYTDYASFGAARYALAWSLVHMLLEKRRPGSEKPFYRDRFAAYFDAVSNGGDPVKSFESIVGPIAAISDEWRAYVEELPLAPLEEGRWHLSQGDTALALPLLEAHRRAAPKDAKGAYWLGEALVLAGRTEEAVVAWREAVELEPNHADALVSLAWGLILLERYPDAVVAAQQAVKVRPSGEHQELLATAAVSARQKAVATAAIREAVLLLGPSAERLKLKAEADALP
jgi:tetratricopeptide (TPR) repeat protein